MKRWLLALLLWPAVAAAQCPTPIPTTGSLLIQRQLVEFFCLGPTAQANARLNLGIANVPLAVPDAPILGGTSPNTYTVVTPGQGLQLTGGVLSPVYGETSQTVLQGSLIGTSGASIPLLNGDNAESGNVTFSGTLNITGIFQSNGQAITLPGAASSVLYSTSPLINGQCLQAVGTAGAVTVSGSACGSGGGGGGSVSTISIVPGNGFSGSVANPTTTPAITLSTTVSGLLKGSGTAISAAVAGTDYVAPTGSGAALTGITPAQVGALALIGGTVTGATTFNFSGTALTLPSGSNAIIGGNVLTAGLTTSGTTIVQAGNGISGLTANNIIRLNPILNPTTTFTAAFGADFTGTGSGTNLTVTSVTGFIHTGSMGSAALSGAGVPAGTYIVSQTSGTAGGAGVYVTNNATTSSSASLQSSSAYMDVTGTVTGTIAIGQTVAAAGLPVGTKILSGSGVTWATDVAVAQNIPSEAMSSSALIASTITTAGTTGSPQPLTVTTQNGGTITMNPGQNTGLFSVSAGAVLFSSTPNGVIGNGVNNNGIFDFNVSDVATKVGNTTPAALNLLDNVSTGSSGGRFGIESTLNIVSGATITGSGIYTAIVGAVNVAANTGDTASYRAGYFNAFNLYCQYTSAVTNSGGCSGEEIDLHNQSAAGQTEGNVGLILQSFSDDTGEGRLGNNKGLVFGATTTSNAIGFDYGMLLQATHFAFTPYAIGIYGAQTYLSSPVPGGGTTPYMASLIDVAGITMNGCTARGPFESDCPMQAQGITTGTTRLTTNGSGTAIGFIEGFNITSGSLYTEYPVIVVSPGISGCAPVLAGNIAAGGLIDEIGISTPATGCPSNTAVTITAAVGDTTGSGAAATPIITGNTLNFAINSAINVECHLVANNSGGTEQLGEHIFFGVSQGATPGTTTIIGSPSWVQDFTNGTPTISFSAPTADTTLGAVILNVVPSAGTWNVGGSCHMTRTTAT